MNSGDEWKHRFESGEILDKWRDLESIWVDMSWFSEPQLTIKKYIKCVGTFCGIGQIDWWVASELKKLSSTEKDELEFLCIKNRDFIHNKQKSHVIPKKQKYNIITLCGSTKFKEEFLEVTKWLSLQGNIVISVGLFGHSTGEKLNADEKFVINVDEYIGTSTKNEIEYAKKEGKKVRYYMDEKQDMNKWSEEYYKRKETNWNGNVGMSLWLTFENVKEYISKSIKTYETPSGFSNGLNEAYKNILNYIDKKNKLEKMGKIEIFKGEDNQFHFRIKARNGEIVAMSEAYKTREGCENGIQSIKENINSEIIDLTL